MRRGHPLLRRRRCRVPGGDEGDWVKRAAPYAAGLDQAGDPALRPLQALH